MKGFFSSMTWFPILFVALLASTQNVKPLWAAPPLDEPIAVETWVNRSTITVGDRIKLRLTVRQPSGTRVETPPGNFLSDEDVEVLELRSLPPKKAADGTETLEFEYILSIFSIGPHKIPSVPITYVNSLGGKGLAFSQEVPIMVESVLGKEGPPDDIRDIKFPMSIPGGLYPYRSWAGAVLVASLVALSTMAIRRRPWFLSSQAGGGVFLSPEDLARKELDHIASLKLVGKKEYKTYYALISLCTRKYLSARYSMGAMALTSQELRKEMEAKGIDRWQARVVYGLLEECDLVRWAQYVPAEARAQRALALASEIVDMAGSSTQQTMGVAQ